MVSVYTTSMQTFSMWMDRFLIVSRFLLSSHNCIWNRSIQNSLTWICTNFKKLKCRKKRKHLNHSTWSSQARNNWFYQFKEYLSSMAVITSWYFLFCLSKSLFASLSWNDWHCLPIVLLTQRLGGVNVPRYT